MIIITDLTTTIIIIGVIATVMVVTTIPNAITTNVGKS